MWTQLVSLRSPLRTLASDTDFMVLFFVDAGTTTGSPAVATLTVMASWMTCWTAAKLCIKAVLTPLTLISASNIVHNYNVPWIVLASGPTGLFAMTTCGERMKSSSRPPTGECSASANAMPPPLRPIASLTRTVAQTATRLRTILTPPDPTIPLALSVRSTSIRALEAGPSGASHAV